MTLVNEVMEKTELENELEKYLRFSQGFSQEQDNYKPKDMAGDIVQIVVNHINKTVMSRMLS